MQTVCNCFAIELFIEPPMSVVEITEESPRPKTIKALLWLGIVSIVMLFAGLTSAYIIRQAKGEWLTFDLPSQFYISTFIILMSSATLFWASGAAKKNNYRALVNGLGITFILGIGFIVSQVSGWGAMIENGIFFTGPGSNVSASFLYVITALHAAHALGGIIALLITLINSVKRKYTSKNILGLQLCSIYWHFLGALWIYLFLFLLFVK